MSDAQWKPGRWYQVWSADSELLSETPYRDEALAVFKAHPGSTIRRIWTRVQHEWRDDLG